VKHFAKTLCITLGRLALVAPYDSAFCLPRIIRPWCISLRYISVSEEKSQAFRGICGMIPFNPMGIADSFPEFCEALIEFKEASEELQYIFRNLLMTYKKCLGDETWNTYLESFPPALRTQLNTRF
jgi:hypothetical protein